MFSISFAFIPCLIKQWYHWKYRDGTEREDSKIAFELSTRVFLHVHITLMVIEIFFCSSTFCTTWNNHISLNNLSFFNCAINRTITYVISWTNRYTLTYFDISRKKHRSIYLFNIEIKHSFSVFCTLAYVSFVSLFPLLPRFRSH